MGHVLSGWDGTNALEAPSNLCECDAFMIHCFDKLTLPNSLPDVSWFWPFILSLGSSSISVSTAFLHMLSQVSLGRLEV